MPDENAAMGPLADRLRCDDTPPLRRVRDVPALGYTVVSVTPDTRAWPVHAAGRAHHAVRQAEVAALLRSRLRRTDTVAALSDGTFACLLHGAPSRERLSLLAWTLLDELARQPPRRERTGRPASIGFSSGPMHGTSCRLLVVQARIAMQRAWLLETGFAFHGSAGGPG